ncbi:MAG: hypothetical protein ACLFPW_12675 [Spirochaetaceae bacterium]
MRRTNNNSNGTFSWKRIIGLLLLAGVLLFAGCESNGAGGGDTTAPEKPSEEEFGKASETGTQASTTMTNSSDADTRTVGYRLSSSLSLYSLFFVGYLEGWEGEEGSYDYGGDTITVEQDGDT